MASQEEMIYCHGRLVAVRETLPGIWRCTGCGKRHAVVTDVMPPRDRPRPWERRQ